MEETSETGKKFRVWRDEAGRKWCEVQGAPGPIVEEYTHVDGTGRAWRVVIYRGPEFWFLRTFSANPDERGMGMYQSDMGVLKRAVREQLGGHRLFDDPPSQMEYALLPGDDLERYRDAGFEPVLIGAGDDEELARRAATLPAITERKPSRKFRPEDKIGGTSITLDTVARVVVEGDMRARGEMEMSRAPALLRHLKAIAAARRTIRWLKGEGVSTELTGIHPGRRADECLHFLDECERALRTLSPWVGAHRGPKTEIVRDERIGAYSMLNMPHTEIAARENMRPAAVEKVLKRRRRQLPRKQ
jgi:hypothetical protein